MKGGDEDRRNKERESAFTCFDSLEEMAKRSLWDKIALVVPSPFFPPGLPVLVYVSAMH